MPRSDALAVRIATPCPVSWDAMAGDARVRFCAICQKCVYDLSALSLREGRALVEESEGRACVRFYERPDGTVMTGDCGFGLQRLRQATRWGALKLAAVLAPLLGLLGAAAFGDDLRKMFGEQVVMGAIAAVDLHPATQKAAKHQRVISFGTYDVPR